MDRAFRNCPICKHSKATLLYQNKMASIGGIDLSFDIVSCQNCNSIYATNLANSEEYAEYYSHFSKYDNNIFINQAKLHFYNKIIEIIQKNNITPNSILDIGCGSGVLLKVISNNFPDCKLYGLDPSPKHAQQLLKEKAEISEGFIESIKPQTLINIDIICIISVIEHLYDPFNSLKKVYNEMKEGSYLLIEVPNIDSFDGKNFEPFAEFSLEHINYFSKESLSTMLTNIGFKIVDCATFSHKFTGSLIIFAQKTNIKTHEFKQKINDTNKINQYIKDSSNKLDDIIKNKIKNIDFDFFLFGAGSHSAKLIIKNQSIFDKHCLGVLDNNSNLQHNFIGQFKIYKPSDILTTMNNINILISSYNSEKQIEEFLKKTYPNNKIYKLYS